MISFSPKIAIIGPACTGKSTLARRLAKHYQTTWVPEYARSYLNRLDRDYVEKDLLEIAKGQIRAEETQAAKNPALLFCDTDLYVIKVWSEHKYNRCATWILQQIAKRSYDLYLHTDIDLPWEDHPQREHPSPAMRSYFSRVYKDIVVHSGTPWAKISGSRKDRLQQAIEAIEKYLN